MALASAGVRSGPLTSRSFPASGWALWRCLAVVVAPALRPSLSVCHLPPVVYMSYFTLAGILPIITGRHHWPGSLAGCTAGAARPPRVRRVPVQPPLFCIAIHLIVTHYFHCTAVPTSALDLPYQMAMMVDDSAVVIVKALVRHCAGELDAALRADCGPEVAGRSDLAHWRIRPTF